MAADAQALQEALSGRYRIEREAGAGGMATVFAAEDLKHHRRVAIKVLSPELASSLGPERFLREIEIAARLSHPHILPLYDSGTAAGLLYYVMPFAEGESLRERLAREVQLPVDEALRIAREVADALGCAHAHGVVHRDIKPENILLQSGHAVVADFGIARAIEAAGAARLTQTGMLIGTPAYMSPEQAGGGRADARSDLYSLGCVLYEMLGGQPPFVGPTAESVVHQHLSVEVPPVTNLRASVPAGVVAALQRALAKSPADRFADAVRMGEALMGAAAAPAPAAAPRARTRMRRVVQLAAAAAVVAVVAIYVLRPGACAPWPAGVAGAIRSLAVLPLENLSGDSSQDYFVDGVTEELINHLSQITALRVISRTSVMSLKGLKLSIPQVARRLHVDGIVEGSVARIGDQVKVSAALVQSAPERQLWARSFEREVRDILALQGELAGAIANELRLRLTPGERSRVTRARTVDPEAHEAYLKGRFYLNKLDESWYRTALDHFQKAVRIDPLYAQGWSGVADSYYYLSNLYLPPREAMPLARAAAEKALSLDSTLAEAHASLGVVESVYDWDWAGAEHEFRRSLELNPSHLQCRHYYGQLLEATGRFDESIAQLQQAVRLDPLSGYMEAVLSWAYYLAGRHDEALALLRRRLNVEPDDALAHYNVGQVYEEKRMYAEAIAELEQGVALADFPGPLAMLCHAYGRAGRRPEALAALDSLKGRMRSTHVSGYVLAIAYSGLGDRDDAFRWLETAYQDRDEDLMLIKVDPKLSELRSDPRFHDLLRRMKLES